jgi:hypothetical protein
MFRSTLFPVVRLLLVLSMGLALGANSASADEAIVTVVPLTAPFTNPCTGEAMIFSGEQHMKVHMVATDQHSQGAIEINWRSAKAVAVVTNASYVATLAFMTVSNAGGAETTIIQSHQNVNRLKEDAMILPPWTGDDFTLTITEKVTINANGVVTVSHPLEITPKCR